MYEFTYLDLVEIIERYEKLNKEDREWLPRLYSKKVIEQTKLGIEMRQKMINKYKAELPRLKEKYKKAEIARLTAELERIKNL